MHLRVFHFHKQRCVRTDTNGDDEDRDYRESRRSRQGTDADPNVVSREFQTIPAPCVASLLAHEHGIAKRSQGFLTRLRGTHPARYVFGSQFLQMKIQFSIETLHFPLASKKHSQPNS